MSISARDFWTNYFGNVRRRPEQKTKPLCSQVANGEWRRKMWWIEMYLAAAVGAAMGFFVASLLRAGADEDRHCTR